MTHIRFDDDGQPVVEKAAGQPVAEDEKPQAPSPEHPKHPKRARETQEDLVEIETGKARERISLTCALGGENHRDNQFIGKEPVPGTGLTHVDIEAIAQRINAKYPDWKGKPQLIDMNQASGDEAIQKLESNDQARFLYLPGLINTAETTTDMYRELTADEWDDKYLDPNKYTRVVDPETGEEKKVRGKVLNKQKRTNLCLVRGVEQEPDYQAGKGRIADLDTKPVMLDTVQALQAGIQGCLVEAGSETNVEFNVVEGNRYYDLKKTGIGFHGDTERVMVVCITVGGGTHGMPMRFSWFKNHKPVGKPIDITLRDGDVYIMSEKAVGCDWKKSSKYTLRHAAGEKDVKMDRFYKK